MAKINDKFVLNFSGGMRGDKSDFQKQSSDMVRIVNFDIDRQGKLTKRRGSHQLGDTISADNLENTFYFQRIVGGAVPVPYFLVNTANSSATIKLLVGSRSTGALTTASGTITLDSVTGFTDTGDDDAEIEGDLFNYTGISGSNLTGVTGLTSSHEANTAVHQWIALDAQVFDGRKGVYYAVLNNQIYIQEGDGSAFTWDGTTMAAVTGEPNARYATTFRQRVYVTSYTSTSSARVSFSDAGDPTTFTVGNNFDVEGERGELITGQRDYNDEFIIFKTNSFFAYDETTLKQRNNLYGAYNHKVHQEINGLVYSFCPEGIFKTNGRTVEKISRPVQEWIDGYRPIRETLSNTIVTNTFATVYDDKYMLYIDDVTVGGVAYTDVVLVYDTILGNWSIYTGLTNFQTLRGLNAFQYGGQIQNVQALFGGDDSGKFYRFFSKSYVDADANNRFTTTGDLFRDIVSDTGNVVSAEVETKLYDLGSLDFKSVGYIRILTENLGAHASFKLEDKKGTSDWKSLGDVDQVNKRFRVPTNTKGYRYAVKLSHSDSNAAPVINGLVFEDIEVKEDKR